MTHLLHSVADQYALGSAVVDIGERISGMVNDFVVRSAVGGRCTWCDEFLHELNKLVELTDGFNLADLYPSCEDDLLCVLLKLQRNGNEQKKIGVELIFLKFSLSKNDSNGCFGRERDNNSIFKIFLPSRWYFVVFVVRDGSFQVAND